MKDKQKCKYCNRVIKKDDMILVRSKGKSGYFHSKCVSKLEKWVKIKRMVEEIDKIKKTVAGWGN